MPRIFSGIQPSGELHIGNYLGAVKNWVDLQEKYTCYYGVVDYHAMTMPYEPAKLRENVWDLVINLLAVGIEKENLFIQSLIPEHVELGWIFNCFASFGNVSRMTQFKDKSAQSEEKAEGFISVGLFDYPVLQAADILIYRADYVPVGKDQEQHLEMARTFANRFNHRYGDVFPEPQAFNYNQNLVKVPSLDGAGKMSKSENQMATLYLADSDEMIRKKVMKAKTDSGPTEKNAPKPDYIENIFLLMKLVSSPATVQQFEDDYNNCNIRYGDLKKQLAEDMVTFIAPIRNKTDAILQDEKGLEQIMRKGAEKANKSAGETMKLVRAAMGLNYF